MKRLDRARGQPVVDMRAIARNSPITTPMSIATTVRPSVTDRPCMTVGSKKYWATTGQPKFGLMRDDVGEVGAQCQASASTGARRRDGTAACALRRRASLIRDVGSGVDAERATRHCGCSRWLMPGALIMLFSRPHFFMIVGVSAVLDQDLERFEQDATERRVLLHDGALENVVEAVGLSDARPARAGRWPAGRNRSAAPARRRTRRSASSARPGSRSAGR